MVDGMPDPALVVVGELLADINVGRGLGDAVLALEARRGGSPANVAVGAARLGVPTAFVGRLARDGMGSWLQGQMRSPGLDLRWSVPAAEPATLALVTQSSAGRASYTFYGSDTADWQWRTGELPPVNEVAGAAVHTGSLVTVLPPGGEVLATWFDALRAGGRTLISYDPNLRAALTGHHPAAKSSVEAWVGRAHLVKVSDDDLAIACPGEQPLEIARRWAESGPEMVVVTHGADGASVLIPGRPVVTRLPKPVAVVDTVGAGDAFAAGLLAWLAAAEHLAPGHLGRLGAAEVVDALDTANLVAALSCARSGADPPERADVAGAPWP